MKCLYCGTKASDGIPFCSSCCRFLLRSPVNVCSKCHSIASVAGALCKDCRNRRLYYDTFYNLGYYTAGMKKVIAKIKFAEFRKGAVLMGELFGSLFKEYAAEYDFLLPVPMSSRRFHERGFNQALEIARGFSRTSGIPLLRGLMNRADTIPFEKMNRQERRRAVSAAFTPSGKIREIKDANVMIIDDVYTTGNTVSTIAHILKKSGGASRVDAGVLAR